MEYGICEECKDYKPVERTSYGKVCGLCVAILEDEEAERKDTKE